MAKLESIINEEEFLRHHRHQVDSKSQKDVFFIWLVIIFISVIAANFLLNFIGGSPTGFVTASQDPSANATLILGSMMVVFVVVLIIGIAYVGITKKDH
ncbi:hypothetical protein JW756_02770 [Candidatus Woesearchaeota archaeon]|nr:hypothetical protein [Candidatus Woesearchaeota archaeon]